MVDKKAIGKKNREMGKRFEDKVRKDLESKNWIVNRWMNNVEFVKSFQINEDGFKYDIPLNLGRLIHAKPKMLFIKGRMILMNMYTGFPDFSIFKNINDSGIIGVSLEEEKEKRIKSIVFQGRATLDNYEETYKIYGIECKSNGYLTNEEKEKCIWLLSNNIFSKIYVAKKGEKRGQIVYTEFER